MSASADTKSMVRSCLWLTAVVLGGIFIYLKLAGLVEWSWWWVAAPLWVLPASVVAIIVLGVAIAYGRLAIVTLLGGASRLLRPKR